MFLACFTLLLVADYKTISSISLNTVKSAKYDFGNKMYAFKTKYGIKLYNEYLTVIVARRVATYTRVRS